jgi:hypothetical protein
MEHLGQPHGVPWPIKKPWGWPKCSIADPSTLRLTWVLQGWPRCFVAKMRLLDQPHGTWVSLETLKLASRDLDHLWNTWVSLKVFFRSAIEHLGHLSHEAPGSASRFLDQLWNTWVSLKVFRSAMESLGQPQVSLKGLGSPMEHLGQPQDFF